MSHLKLVWNGIDECNHNECDHKCDIDSTISNMYKEQTEAMFKTKPKPITKIAGFRYAKTKGTYTRSKVSFNERTEEAYSYDWWCFVKRINGKLIFNDYSYSSSTRKHQYKVRFLLTELGLNIHMKIDAPKGLQDLDSAINYYNGRINELKTEMTPRSKPSKNMERKMKITEYEAKIEYINTYLIEKAA